MIVQSWKWCVIMFILFSSCIGDDLIQDEVKPELRIMNKVQSIEVGTNYQFEVIYFNNVGLAEPANIQWSTSNSDIISITSDGLASAIITGNVVLSASVNNNFGNSEVKFDVEAGMSTVSGEVSIKSGKIVTTSSYRLEGDFILEPSPTGINLSLAENYFATSALPGLYIYLSNNPNSISGALEIGSVEVFSGAHNYKIDNVTINDYDYIVYFCKPFNVKVGEGNIQG